MHKQLLPEGDTAPTWQEGVDCLLAKLPELLSRGDLTINDCRVIQYLAGQHGEPVTEYGILMSGGGFHIRSDDPEVEKIYPLAQWLPRQRRFGGHVYRRRVVVVEDWVEVGDDGEPL